LLILLFVFVISLLVMFVLYSQWRSRSDNLIVLNTASVEDLTYRQDLARFLTVYLEQDFSDPGDKIAFLLLEKQRFAQKSFAIKDADYELNQRLLEILNTFSEEQEMELSKLLAKFLEDLSL